MSTPATAVPGKPGKKAKPLTDQQKRIKALLELKSKATDKQPFADALNTELKALVAAERKLTLARLANSRVNKLVDLLRQIGNLGAYKPNTKQTKMTFDVIKNAVEAAEAKWSPSDAPETDGFVLPVE